MRWLAIAPHTAVNPLASADGPRRQPFLPTALREIALRTWYRVRPCRDGTNLATVPARYDSRGGAVLTTTEADTTEPRPGGQARVLTVVCAAVFLSVLNGSIVNVVLPTIGQELVVEPALLGWVVTAYSLVYAVAIPFFGRLADIFGPRRFFVAGQAVFALGSLLCVLAPSFPLLIVARIVQSAGGAAIPGLGMTLIARAYPKNQIGTVAGLMSAMVGVGSAIGPTIGGTIASAFGWHAAFAVGAVAGLLVPASWAWLPREQRERGRIGEPLDVWGGLFLAATISGALLALTEGARNGLGSPSAIAAGIASIGGLVALVTRQLRTAFPFIPHELLSNSSYRAVSLITVCAMASSFGVLIGAPLLLARVNGLSATEIGLVLLPNAALSALLAVVFGRLADRVGSQLPVRGGLFLMAAALVALSIAVGSAGWLVSALLAVLGAGTAMVATPLQASIPRILRPERLASGQSITTMLFFFGGSLGATLTTAVLSVRASATDALNVFHQGDGVGFSDAFLLLIVPVVLAFLLSAAVPGRTVPEPRPATQPVPAPTSRVSEPSAPS
jgi:DHA2 family metal-tetracycline-proton antiporter-like MFS transporter